MADSTPNPAHALLQFPTGSDFSNGVSLPVLQATQSSAKVSLPSSLSAGVYAVEFEPTTASNIHAIVNIPLIQWWMGVSTVPGSTGDSAYAGQELDIFGRNFGASPSVWVSANGIFTPVTVIQSNPYRVRMTLPSALSPGNYQLWVHNGYGGNYGFATPVVIAVSSSPAAWPRTVFDVKTFGAKGDGKTDDTRAVQAALKAATAQSGGVVSFPAGNYLVDSKLSVPPNTIIEGASATTTQITTPSAKVSNHKFASIFSANSHVVIQDLTISSNSADFIVTCPDAPRMYNTVGVDLPVGAACADLTLQRLNITHTTVQPLQPNGVYRGSRALNLSGVDIRVLDSSVQSKNLYGMILVEPKNAIVSGNVFMNGKLSMVQLTDSQRSIIENNDIGGTDPTGICIGNQNRIDQVYVAGNYIHDCNGTYGEGFSEDTPYAPYLLTKPVSISAADGSMTFSTSLIDPNPYVPAGSMIDLSDGYIAVVVGGAGAGQMKRITANTFTHVSVESNWQVPLDSTSVIDLQVDKSQDIFYQNSFLNASVGVQLYSQAYENVIDENTGVNTGGSYCMGSDYPWTVSSQILRRFSYCYYNEWIDNSFDGNLPDSNSNRDHELPYPNAFVGEAGSARPFTATDLMSMGITKTALYPAIMFMGNSIRDNTLQNNTTLGFIYGMNMGHVTLMPATQDYALSLDLLVEGNHVKSCQPSNGTAQSSPIGIDIYAGAMNTVMQDNQVSDCAVASMNSSLVSPLL